MIHGSGCVPTILLPVYKKNGTQINAENISLILQYCKNVLYSIIHAPKVVLSRCTKSTPVTVFETSPFQIKPNKLLFIKPLQRVIISAHPWAQCR